jgi:hypothetical protein
MDRLENAVSVSCSNLGASSGQIGRETGRSAHQSV